MSIVLFHFETRVHQKATTVEYRGKILHILAPLKFTAGWAKCLSEFYEAYGKISLVYYLPCVSRPSGRLESGCEKERKKERR